MLFEMITLGRPDWKDLESRFEFEGTERFEEARRRGKGVILVTAHFGNWELHGVAHGYRFGKIHLVAREQDNPYLNRWLEEIRGISGNQVVYKERALAQMRKLIREKETVAIVTDQNVHLQDAVFVDFFGRKAAATPIASWFALKTGAAIVPAFCYPLPSGRYRAVYEDALDLEPYRKLDRTPPHRDHAGARVASRKRTSGASPTAGSGCTGGGAPSRPHEESPALRTRGRRKASPRRLSREPRIDSGLRPELDRRRGDVSRRGAAV